MRVLVVDDEPAVRIALTRALRFDGHDVDCAKDGREALDRLAESPAEIVLLDVMMPGVDGLQVVRRLRSAGNRTPILMLTARDALDERVAGLDAGADDYLVKPFELDELRARIRALSRRAGPDVAEVLEWGDIRMDLSRHQVTRAGRSIELTRTEHLLLELFLRHPGRVLSRRQILEKVWGYDFGNSSNSLGVYVSYLRGKLEAAGEPRVLQNVRSVGYVLRMP